MLVQEPVHRGARFVPAGLVRRLGGATAVGATERRFEGAVLVADISGYTALTVRYADDLSLGVEELSRVINRSFEAYLDRIYAHGGEVAFFAGDAVCAYWPADAQELSVVMVQAARCAIGLRALEGVDGVNPDLHIGLGAGPLWVARVSAGEGRQAILFGGEALREATAAERAAEAGEAQLGPTCAALLAGLGVQAPGGRLGELAVEVESTSATHRALRGDLRAILPRTVAAQLLGNDDDNLAEMRNVTVLFAKIDGLSESDPGALAAYEALADALYSEVGAGAGELLIDDKGLVFFAPFGVPHDAGPDDARRAVAAAATIERIVSAQGLRCAIGIDTGRAFCGPLGTEARSAYVTLSPAMNGAARLMMSAGHGALCSEAVVSKAGASVKFGAAAALQLKGLPGPIYPRRVVGREHTASRFGDTPLLGRAAEMAVLTGALGALLEGRNSIVEVVGEAGMGKSTLVSALLKTVWTEALRVQLLGGEASDQRSSFRAWRGLFFSLFGVEEGHSEAQTVALITTRLAPWPRLLRHAPLLSAVFGFAPEETANTEGLGPVARAEATLQILSKCINRLGQGPLCLLVEDVHWLDSASWRLLVRVARHHAPLMLVLTSRPIKATPRALSLLRDFEGYQGLELKPLDSAAIGALLGQKLGGQVAPEVVEAVMGRTLGHPHFAEQFGYLLRERGAITRFAGVWRTRGQSTFSPAQIPTTVSGLLTSRIDQLSSAAQWALKAGALIGRRFDRESLAAIYPSDVEQLDDALGELVVMTLLQLEDRTYVVDHAVTVEVAYGLLLDSQRRRLHSAFAAWCEAHPTRTLRPAVLARHWYEAGEAAHTVMHASQAAAAALSAGAWTEAIEFLNWCVELTEEVETPRAICWRRSLADAYAANGQTLNRRTNATLALRQAGYGVPSVRISVLWTLVTRLLTVVWRHGIIKRVPARQVTEAEGRLAGECCRAWRHVGMSAFFANEPINSSVAMLAAVVHGERGGQVSGLDGAYAELSPLMSVLNLRGIGERLHHLALGGGAADQAYAYMTRSMFLVGDGAWAACHEALGRAQVLSVELGDDWAWGNAQVMRMWMLHYQGKFEVAEHTAAALLERARRNFNRQHEAWAIRYHGIAAARRGDTDSAVSFYDEGLFLIEGQGDQVEVVGARAGLASALAVQGKIASAISAVEQSLVILESSPKPMSHATWSACDHIAEALYQCQALEPTLVKAALVERSMKTLKRYKGSFKVGRPLWRMWRGRWLVRRGRLNAGRRCLSEAANEAAEMGMLGIVACARDTLDALSP